MKKATKKPASLVDIMRQLHDAAELKIVEEFDPAQKADAVEQAETELMRDLQLVVMQAFTRLIEAHESPNEAAFRVLAYLQYAAVRQIAGPLATLPPRKAGKLAARTWIKQAPMVEAAVRDIVEDAQAILKEING